MPWTMARYPASMNNLAPIVREKAIAIANALLASGHPEGQAIRIAIARAHAWARRRGGEHSALFPDDAPSDHPSREVI